MCESARASRVKVSSVSAQGHVGGAQVTPVESTDLQEESEEVSNVAAGVSLDVCLQVTFMHCKKRRDYEAAAFLSSALSAELIRNLPGKLSLLE